VVEIKNAPPKIKPAEKKADVSEELKEESTTQTKETEAKPEKEKPVEPTQAEADAPETEADGETAADKKPTKKKNKKDKKDEKIEELNDRLMRNLAEFENFRNRSEKEKSAMFEIGAKSVIEKILPVVDNLERGFDGLSEEEKETPFVKGIEAVYKQLLTAFEEMDVKPIEAVGKEFDPNFHNAVMHEEDDSEAVNQVIEEFQKGYLYKDSVVRHSMVKVLN
jgi:molecular chaperone GrpE